MAIEVPLHYSIDDLKSYEKLAPPDMRDDLLRSVAQRELMQYASTLTVNDLLAAKREALQNELRRRINTAFDAMNAGVRVLFVGADGIHPPQETAMSFEQVVGAEQKYHARLKTAEGDAIKTLTAAAGSVDLAKAIVTELDRLAAMDATVDGKPNPKAEEQRLKIRTLIQNAGGQAAALLLDASADRWHKHMSARAALSSYRGQLGAYRAAPGIYRAGLYLDALRSAMADARVIVTDSKNLKIRTTLEDRENVADIFRSQEQSQ
jgi:regulator of protease activity HflC (stomatin/prohibitin superfamily)